MGFVGQVLEQAEILGFAHRDFLPLNSFCTHVKLGISCILVTELLGTSLLPGSVFRLLGLCLLLLELHLSLMQFTGIFESEVNDQASVSSQLQVVQVPDSVKGDIWVGEFCESQSGREFENFFTNDGGFLAVSQYFDLLDEVLRFGLLFVFALFLVRLKVFADDGHKELSEMIFVEITLGKISQLQSSMRY